MKVIREANIHLVYSFDKIKRINLKNANKIKIKVLRGIADPKVHRITIDLKGLEFIDTFGAKVLVTLRKFAFMKQKRFYLQNVNEEFMEIMKLLKLDKDFEIISNVKL